MKRLINPYLGIEVKLKKYKTDNKLENYIITDTDNYQIKREFKNKYEALKYIAFLLDATTKTEYDYIKHYIDADLEEGDIIEFENGRKAYMLKSNYDEAFFKYRVIRKDNKIGKIVRLLYPDIKYTIL